MRRPGRKTRLGAAGAAVAALVITAGLLVAVTLDRSTTDAATAGPSDATAATPAGPAGCIVTRLPTGGFDQAVVTGGDPSGRFVIGRGWSVRNGSHRRGAIWRDGELLDEVRIPGVSPGLNDINSHGVAVGDSHDAEDRRYPYVYRNGAISRLPGGQAAATAINDAGVIIGVRGGSHRGPPVRWASPTAQPVDLPLPPGATSAYLFDIDEDGTIVGIIPGDGKGSVGYLWLPDGTGRKMPLPSVDGGTPDSFSPNAIRNGWVVGNTRTGGGENMSFTPFRYRVGTGRYERLPGQVGHDLRVSAAGWVLSTRGRPTVFGTGDPTILPPYGPLSGVARYSTGSISDDGLVAAGYGHGDDFRLHPLLWRCR